MKIIVISLGGSLIIPDKIDFKYLHKFKATLRKFYKTHKFVIVCGGGSIARTYIDALKAEGKSQKDISLAGIRATRMNALVLTQFFGKEANKTLPKDMNEVFNLLPKNNVVICGALRFLPHETSDGTTAHLANHLNTEFINLTNVSGLYTKDPRKFKNAKLISSISWKEFDKIAKALKFKAGQHFVLDQEAAEIIKEYKIPTYILGRDLKQLENLLKEKKFIGTTIKG